MSAVRISYVLPTRDRGDRLSATLSAIDALGPHDAEVIVVDNASAVPARVGRLASGVQARLIRLDSNHGAAARNDGAAASDPASDWIVMLDDDSHPIDLGFLDALREAPADVLAVSADIWLPAAGRRESGGLPEVFIGCGVAFRRDWLLASGGYDPTFGYYVEEYDLAARLLIDGGCVSFDPRFRVAHHKVEQGRNMDLILRRLVRNNGWVAQRYAPEHARREELRELRGRYRAIAAKEDALAGYTLGLLELRRTIRAQERRAMRDTLFDRFTGLEAAREGVARAIEAGAFATAAVVERGKNAWAVERALEEAGIGLVGEHDAEALVLGSMSPGPMIDGLSRRVDSERRVVTPWSRAAGAASMNRWVGRDACAPTLCDAPRTEAA